MENKEYVIFISRAGGGIERVAKTEDQLTEKDFHLFLGELVEQFNKSPERTKIEFLHRVCDVTKTKIDNLIETQTTNYDKQSKR